MELHVPRSGVGLDPLIAEAKRRTRRRRVGVAVALVAIVALAVALSLSLTGTSRMGAVSPQPPTLRNAFALGTVVRVDASSGVAVFRIKCGWYYAPRIKLQPGLWRVALRHDTFSLYGGYTAGNYAGGSATPVSLREWERAASSSRGWSGSLRLGRLGGWISDGPTTDICGGVPG